MAVQTKICGISTPEALHAAIEGGAGWVGFVFFPRSPRHLTVEAAGRLAAQARGRVKIVALAVDPSDALVDEIAGGLRPDLFQLHGGETPARVREIGQRAGAGLIKALPVAAAADVDAAAPYEGLVDHLLFDAKPSADATRPGGVGVRFDGSVMAGRRFARPWFLAGGLDPWNLTEAVEQSGAPLLDVSSGVERGPGLKDPALIAAFLDAARRV
jgi:phosphoribosylanthranilate isomerase